MSRTSKIVYFIISIIFFTCFDLVLSDFVVKNIEKFPQNSVLDLISVQNTGAAFSIFLERLITSILMAKIPSKESAQRNNGCSFR